jgi:calcineurin-like phosphoesterase family protein
MNRIFVIADTHFGHKKIIQFEGVNRPFATVEEHDAELVRRWNAAVKPKDTVWHLGDVLFGRNSFDILGQLNGVKKLVMGNHDRYPSQLYMEHFNQVVGAAEVRDCILTHIPVHPSQFERYKANIHGHLHSKMLDDARYINVSAECIGLVPTPLDDLLKRVDELHIN